MENKLFSILILSSLFIVGFQSIAGAEITLKETDNTYDIQTDNSSHDEFFRLKEPKNEETGNFDMYLECIGWWSPSPVNKENGVLCWNILIDSVGEWDDSKSYISTISVYAVFSNGDTIKLSYKEEVWGQISPGYIVYPYLGWMHSGPLYGPEILEEKPNDLIVELETSYPDEPTENNQKTVAVSSGITIHGYANQKDKFGETNPVYTVIIIKADESHFFDSYFEGRAFPEENSYYYVYAPFKTGYIYPVEAINNDNGKRMTKYVSSVEEFKIYTLDFVFSKSRSLNFLKVREFFVNFFESYLKLFPILNYFHNTLNRIKS